MFGAQKPLEILKLIFSESEVAGNRATGQVTRERRRKPFQLARGAMGYSGTGRNRTGIQAKSAGLVPGAVDEAVAERGLARQRLAD